MNQIQHRFSHTILLACAFIAFTGTANADIVKCIDENGSVLLTDAACNANSTTAGVYGAVNKPAVRTKAAAQQRRFAETERARTNAAKIKLPASRRFALDVATSTAARASLASIDEASALQRQQVLLEQEARPTSAWAFWRS